MLTCGEVGSDVHALIKALAIRRVEHKTETHSNESQHLAEGTEVERLRRRFSFCFTAGTFIPHASPSLQTGGGACEHPKAPFSKPSVCARASYRTERVTEFEGRAEATGVGGGIEAGGENGDGNRVGGGNGDVNGGGGGARAGTATATEVEVDEGVKDGNGGRSRDGAGMGTGTWGQEPWTNTG